MKIAVLITVYNRREKTLKCLENLSNQTLPGNFELRIFVTDDKSTDGTTAAIKIFYPHVQVFKGNGFLYWAGGMRYTYKQSLPYKPDYYLLLNDDTDLYKDAITNLINCVNNNASEPCICIGSTRDNTTKNHSYGGYFLTSRHQWKSNVAYSDKECLHCDFGNANIMLISAGVIDNIGFLSESYTHSLADYDYTLQARKAGYEVLLAPGFLGECTDDHGNNWKSAWVPLKERIKYLKSPTGLAYREYLTFIKRHFPLSYPAALTKLWMKTFFPFLWDRLKGKAQ